MSSYVPIAERDQPPVPWMKPRNAARLGLVTLASGILFATAGNLWPESLPGRYLPFGAVLFVAGIAFLFVAAQTAIGLWWWDRQAPKRARAKLANELASELARKQRLEELEWEIAHRPYAERFAALEAQRPAVVAASRPDPVGVSLAAFALGWAIAYVITLH